eukprot:COSAG06_NODE_17399_length_943_cov_1.560427_1_plen_55_part_00
MSLQRFSRGNDLAWTGSDQGLDLQIGDYDDGDISKTKSLSGGSESEEESEEETR